MSEDRTLAYGSPLPATWLAALQEFLSTMSANLRLSLANPNTVQIIAGADNAQVTVGISGLFRYISATINAAVTGAAGQYDIFVTTGPNNFVSNPAPPPPELDDTNYAFALSVLPHGTTPTLTGVLTAYRQIGSLTWDGSSVTVLQQTVGDLQGDPTQTHMAGDLIFTAAAARSGALFCDGAVYNRSAWPILYAAIGTTYGIGDGTSGSFNVPDFTGMTVIGGGSSSGAANSTAHSLSRAVKARGNVGGANTVVLTATQIPGHTHGYSGSGITGFESAAHNHGMSNPPINPGAAGWGPFSASGGSGAGSAIVPSDNNFAGGSQSVTGNENQNHQHAFSWSGTTDGGTGGGGSHENMPPYGVVGIWIKT